MGQDLAHLVADAEIFLAFGALLFDTLIARLPLRRLLVAALILGLGGLGLWLANEATAFDISIPQTLVETTFGHVLAIQALLLIAATAVRGWPGTILAAVAVACRAAQGHGWAMGDAPDLVLSHSLHLLAAAAWLGGLPALALALSLGIDRAALRFSHLATIAVIILAGSALYQGWALGGGLPGLIGTDYGQMLGLKALLLFILLGIAAVNRFRMLPRLPASRVALTRSVLIETAIGLATVFAAVLLGTMEPGMHMQPNWPFSLRPDGFAFADPDLRAEVLGGIGWCVGAVVLLCAGLRWRWAWLGVPLALWLGVPHLDLLLVPAYPTSYWMEPDAPSDSSIARGAALYPPHCAVCHGAGGKGDGPLAKTLPIPPADLTAAHLWDHADGELFWWLSNGMPGPDGKLVMPGFADRLSEADRWALIDVIRARNPNKGMPMDRSMMMMMHHG